MNEIAKIIFGVAAITTLAWFVVSIWSAIEDIPKQLKRIADELEKLRHK